MVPVMMDYKVHSGIFAQTILCLREHFYLIWNCLLREVGRSRVAYWWLLERELGVLMSCLHPMPNLACCYLDNLETQQREILGKLFNLQTC